MPLSIICTVMMISRVMTMMMLTDNLEGAYYHSRAYFSILIQYLHASHPIQYVLRGYRIHLISDIIHLTRQWYISRCRSVYDPFYIPLSFPNLHRHILLVQPYNVALYCSKSIQRHLSGENPRRMFSNPDSFQLQLSSSRNCPSQTIETFNVLCCSLAGW